MELSTTWLAWGLAATAGCALAAGADDLVRVAPADWQVTRGAPVPDGQGGAIVREPTFRAVAPASDGNAAELRFSYLGASERTALLASGELRRQIGLKLRAQDGCNLVYVIWRIEPRAELVVSLKRNPGQRTHDECGANGYVELQPRLRAELPPVGTTEHRLRARLIGRTLTAWVDGWLVWQGDVGAEALAIDGPAGARSDNGRFELELRARPSAALKPSVPLGTNDEE